MNLEKKYNKNNIEISCISNKTLNNLFQEIVRKTPLVVAVKYEDERITYKDLNRRANKLAHYLKKQKSFKRGSIIGVEIERSINLIIANIAIHKAGAVCLTIDSEMPEKRKKYLFKNAGVKIVLFENLKNKRKIKNNILEYVYIKSKKIVKESAKNPKQTNKISDPAYIVYTSGSTGRPKGAIISHKNIVSSVCYRAKVSRISNIDKVALCVNTSFVPFIYNVYLPFLYGARLVVLSQKSIKNSLLLFEEINKTKSSLAEIPVSMINFYLETISLSMHEKYDLKNLRIIWSSGEKDSSYWTSFLKKEYQHIKYFTVYGSTEYSMSIIRDVSLFRKKTMTEGTPSDNTQVYILDKDLKLLPKNIPGELYVSGDGLAKGYINNKKETKKSFLPHPYKKGKIIYKTGDRALMHSDGNIEILGRIDNQIKINGKRIELGEIESVVKKMINIEEAIGVATEDINKESKQIALYYKVIKGEKIKEEEIRSSLKKELPDYMIPKYYFRIKKFPLNSNGKIDRKKLPKVDEKNLIKNKYEEPKTETEKQIAEIWKKVLKVKKVGRNDNFFDLGGDSIDAMKVVFEVNKKFNQINFMDLLVNPILKDFLKYVTPQKNK
jgi:amino acid adenylation domain-containing protein